MIVRSKLPNRIAEVDGSWREGWEKNSEIDFKVFVDGYGSRIRFKQDNQDEFAWHPGMQALATLIDIDFRGLTDTPQHQPMVYAGKYRHGTANAVQPAAPVYNRFSHYDGLIDPDPAIDDCELPEMYNYFVSTEPTTLWYQGRFLSLFPVRLHTKPTRPLRVLNHAFLTLQTAPRQAYSFGPDWLVRAYRTAVHAGNPDQSSPQSEHHFMRVTPLSAGQA